MMRMETAAWSFQRSEVKSVCSHLLRIHIKGRDMSSDTRVQSIRSLKTFTAEVVFMGLV